MTDTPNLGLPFIEGGQAQKHVTHNEALRILDAAIQIAVRDITRTAPPASPAEGQRHVVAAGASGAWSGRAQTIATWQDGAWAYLVPKPGWCIWSVADDVMMVFDGSAWRDLRNLALDNVAHLGVHTSADSSNRLAVKSNAALFAATDAASGGSGDIRVQLSKEAAARTASLLFADNYSGRAEFGLVGSDAFKLKVSPDGSAWTEALAIDQASGNLALPRGLALTGVIAPAQLVASQNDYAPAGLTAAAVLQISADAPRTITGLAGGAEGRVVSVVNVGSQPVTLQDDSASSAAANRFALGGPLTIAGRQAAVLRYDGAALRWQALAGGLGLRADAAQALSAAQQAQARANLGVRDVLTAGRTYYVRPDGSNANSGLANTAAGAFLTIQKAIDVVYGTLDLGGFGVTIQLAAGTYAAGISVTSPQVGAGAVTLQGDVTTPANVTISVTAGNAAMLSNKAVLNVAGLKLVTAGSGIGLYASTQATINITGKMEFGPCAQAHLWTDTGGQIVCVGINYTISGGSTFHAFSSNGGLIQIANNTVTLTGTPAFSGAYAYASALAISQHSGQTFSGMATGLRYSVSVNAIINSGGGGGSYLPGSSAGATLSNGLYV